MNDATETYDLIVVGAGAAGLATANRAIDLGARVLVLEKAGQPGGSAALSAGILWTAPDLDTLHRIQPDADPVLGPLVVESYQQAVDDVRAAGVTVSEPWHDHLEWGTARKIDIAALFEVWSQKVESSGSLRTGVSGVELVRNGDAVVGVRYRHDDAQREAHAGGVVLATGGFQGDAQLKQTFIGNGADDIAVRSNPNSVGDGLRLGLEAGAATSRHLSGFYGHTLPSPLAVDASVFLRLTLYFSAYGIIVNRQGRRFTDESLGDEVSNQFLVRQPGHRGVLIWDDEVQQQRALAVPYPSGMALDRHAAATKHGARTAEADTLEELVEIVSSWSVDAAGLTSTLDAYRRASTGESVALDAPLPHRPSPLSTPPFRAVEIQPCITIPFGGLRVDGDSRVLDHDGAPVSGLYAAGADAGGAQDLRYIGGIVFGLVFGRRAADHALASVLTRA
ncbi:FAD-dependent oxidoreductase [Microbacterium saperdae]|uniref:Succinate dehydrogenase/fumarate reductase flavoprotein subunit n=1 Tax=Microbacterium saperdae TaxID=69368 RepID=A0A543BLB9_9MICO|nr:FAD-dependent oxidoreductase [Microbacterium saperdae]TQL85616.1 succinate dehydrogenase/fumarate reductase flavoprotein subunit [Microbacterium saperdae]GGM62200.1 flavocytochrome c [Microbacterium saperdae]